MIKYVKSIQAFHRSKRYNKAITVLLVTTADTMWISDEDGLYWGLYWWQIDKDTILDDTVGAKKVVVPIGITNRLQKYAWVFLSPLSYKHDRLGNIYVEIP